MFKLLIINDGTHWNTQEKKWCSIEKTPLAVFWNIYKYIRNTGTQGTHITTSRACDFLYRLTVFLKLFDFLNLNFLKQVFLVFWCSTVDYQRHKSVPSVFQSVFQASLRSEK
jgi:hypothetical protein